MSRTGWVALQGQILGSPEQWEMVYHWDGKYHETKDRAIRAGFEMAESDDFNVGRVEDGRLVWFGWMGEKHPEEDYYDVAKQFCWSAP